MSSLVLELQQDALNPSIDLPGLLRKALLVSRKLGVNDFQTWIENELNGYEDTNALPEYRKIHGFPQGLNPYRGWQPIVFANTEYEKFCSLCLCTQSVSNLTALIAIVDSKSQSDIVPMAYPAKLSKALSSSTALSPQVRLAITVSSVVGLLDTVRTVVLKWAMKLQEDNILGEGMTFTPQEKSIARSATYNVTNFYGPITSSQIQQQTSDSSQCLITDKLDIEPIVRFLAEIKEKLSELPLSIDMEQEINAEVNTIDAQVSSPKPKAAILRESLSSIRRILEGTVGAIAAELLLHSPQF